eukprot:CAMPEP_0183727022 /NCGR_PEP_ID=MMETSP0737-20130205/24617_1 /TAXON_ID=385413 /ORGANISM="Thalassiosira miniscula, Strain CCMP1093" /LENGTH=398 /DNA_ID=CAMNT_0025958537 /DNA_START=148 /DNA_END=1344 /DNA_ORIENTATION=+
MSLSIPSEHIPPGMNAVHVGVPFLSQALEELTSLKSQRVFVLANNSSRKFLEGDNNLMDVLETKGMLAAPLCTSIGMGGGELGLLSAADEARAANADVIVTVGGGAVQDAGKLIRLWLSAKTENDDSEKATVAGIQAASNRDPMPPLPPQIAIPNSFAMAEATHVAGITTTAKTKSGAAHKSLMPTVIVYDPALSAGLPDWVRFGTALRGVEHAVGAVTHPKANEDIRSRALTGLSIIHDNLKKLVKEPECAQTQSNLYVGGFMAIRALNTGCYPALGHLIQNQYSARFDVHQGSCSGILCARIMDYHSEKSNDLQKRIAAALGDESVKAPILVRDLVSTLPGVSNAHEQVKVSDDMLKEFTEWMFANHIARYNALSPKEFTSAEDIYGMMTKPLEEL